MTVQEIRRQQEALMPRGDLAPYGGKWVAVRDGEIIASDIDPERLRQREDVQPDDALMPIAHSDRGYFIL
jgi:hypothetical protein